MAGYIEPHARPDTQAMAEGLEEIPPLMVDYKGIQLREFNLDAALERKPKLILVDELAHTNVRGAGMKALSGCTGAASRRDQCIYHDEYPASGKPQ